MNVTRQKIKLAREKSIFMNTTKKGNAFEEVSLAIIKQAIEDEKLGLPEQMTLPAHRTGGMQRN